jgi:hypothetical protein
VLSVLALVALMGLAAGMRSMTFREGQAFGQNEPDTAPGNPAELIRAVLSIPLQTQLIFWAMILGMIALIALLMSPEGRKRLLRTLFRAAITYWVLYTLFTRYPQVLGRLGMAFAPTTMESGELSDNVPPPVFTPPPPTSWMTYLLSFLIVALAVFILWRAYSIWKQRKASASDEPASKLVRIARASLHDLASGRDSSDVILNCYFRMSDVVSEKRNLSRSASMTPHEFATRLERAGLPGDPVKQLTRLFEAIRYGGQRSSPLMVKEAVACLTTILQYCGEPV